MSHSEDLLRKTLTTARFFAGGELNAEQQDKFVVVVREFGGFLRDVSMVRLRSPQMDIDKVYVGEPITEAASEDTNGTTYHTPNFNKISVSTAKMRAAYYVTTEALQSNLEQSGFEDTLISMMSRRHAMDIELLAVQGDASISLTTDGDTRMNRLLRIKDGWDIQTEAAIILDAGGDTINKDLFDSAWDAMPRHYRRNSSNLRWIMNRSLWNDYSNLIADRPTPGGDDALFGRLGNFSPSGIKPLFVDTIPDFKPLSIATATPATIVGDVADVFEITSGTNSRLEIDVDNAGAVVVNIATGVYSCNAIAALINAVSGLEGVASTDVDGHLILTSPTTGATSEVELVDTTGGAVTSDCYLTLGLVANSSVAVTFPHTVNGAAAGAGTNRQGTFMWLADPAEFLWALLDRTRIYAEYQKGTDRVETVIYDQMDFKVQNLDAIVKVNNIARLF